MARRVPTDLTMLARLYELWEPQEDARRQISEDLKELFAEAKGNGYNPKALRKAFAERYRLDHQTDEQALKANQTDEDTELYLSALARVRESDAEDDTQARLNSVRTRIVVTAANNGPPEQDEHESTAVDLDGMGDQDAPAHPVDTNSEALTLASDADGSNPAITTGGDDMPVVPAFNNHRIMSMTPLEPRTAGGLKGFGFTVSFDERPVVAGGVQVPHRGEVA